MAKILKQLSKQLIPFTYKLNDIDAFCGKTADNGKAIWEKKVFTTNHLFDYINAKQTDGKQGIMTALTVADGARKYLGIPNANTEIRLKVRGKQSEPIVIKLKSVSLYLFETKVGFVDLDFEYSSDKTDDYVNANYFLSELKSKDNVLNVKTGKDDYAETSITEMLEKIFGLFDKAYGFDKDNALSYYDLKPLLFSAVILDKMDNDETYLLNHASRNFKDSYQTEDVKTLRPFANSAWAGTDTAIVNVSHLTDNRQTDDFFLTQFINAVRNNYFYLYLLTLNQKFTLLKRLSQIAQINPKYVADEEELKRQDGLVSALIYKSQLYDARCSFACPSSMRHINDFYDYARECQGNAAFEKELKSKSKALTEIHGTYKTRLDGYKHYRNTKLTFWVFILSQIIGSVTMFTSCCKLVSDLLDVSVREQPVYYLIPVILTLIFAVTLGIQIFLKAKELKKLKTAIKTDKQKDR